MTDSEPGTAALLPARGWELLDADWNHWPDDLGDAATWAAAAAAGFDGIELGVYDAAVELAPARLQALARLADAHHLPVRGVLLSLPPARWPGGALTGRPEAVAAQALACAQVCVALGIGTLGLWPGADPEDADFVAVVDGLRLVAEAVAPTGVRVAVEYKPETAVPDAETALALAAAVPGTGVLLDTGHAFALGEDPAAVVRHLAAQGVLWHLHLGDDDLPVGRLHDIAGFLQAVAETGFTGSGSLDLRGAVAAGVATGVEAAAESLAALGGPR